MSFVDRFASFSFIVVPSTLCRSGGACSKTNGPRRPLTELFRLFILCVRWDHSWRFTLFASNLHLLSNMLLNLITRQYSFVVSIRRHERERGMLSILYKIVLVLSFLYLTAYIYSKNIPMLLKATKYIYYNIDNIYSTLKNEN